MIGRTISHYRITGKLGEGGMGVVYQAEDLQLRRTVALKFLPAQVLDDPTERMRLVHEAQAAASLQHPSICTVHEIGEADGQTFIAMEYLGGQSLKDRLAAGPLTVTEALDIARQLGEGLQRAHAQGIVHRDLKPANVMLTEDGRAVLMDFGLAKMSGATRLTRTGTTLGTVAYMAPEQARGQDVDARADIWALGVVTYEMLAGKPPFTGDSIEATVAAILTREPTSLADRHPDISFALEQVVTRALAKDPGKRYPQVADLIADLREQRDQLDLGLKPERFVRLRRLRRQRRFVGAAAAVVLALLVAVLGKLYLDRNRAIDAIAVLPFVDMSLGDQEEWFADGMTDALITELQQFRALRVIGRTSVMRFRDTQLSLPEIAGELGVDALIEASVVRSGEMVKIAAKLIKARPEQLLWAENFERGQEDILQLQAEVAGTIARQIRGTLSEEEAERSRQRKQRTISPEAYQAYLMGRHWWNKGNVAGYEKCIAYFQEAITREPDFVLGLVGLADGYAALGCHGARPPFEVYPKARALLERALALDPASGEAHATLGHITMENDWDFAEAERVLRRAIELNPSYSTAYHIYAGLMVFTGQADEAVPLIKRAYELEPLSPNINADMVWIFDAAGDLEAGARQMEIYEQMFPTEVSSGERAWFHWRRDQRAESVRIIEDALRDRDSFGLKASLAKFYAEMGRKEEARQILSELLAQRETRYIRPTFFASIYRALGDNENAILWYEKGFEVRDPGMTRLLLLGVLESEDPRLVAIARRVGFGS